MPKQEDRVLILHGWGGSDFPHWQAHLASKIAKNYGTVSFPLLDNCHFPSKNRWLKQLKSIMKTFQPTVIVCHSLANTLWFWLCQEEDALFMGSVKKLFMVSPPSLQTTEPTIKTFFPCALPNTIYPKETHLIVSDNDIWTSVEEAKSIALHYNASFTVIPNAKHINADSNYGEWELIEKLVMEKK